MHYPRIMRRFGPAWNMSTMRCESKNRKLKTTSQVSLSRINIIKTLAIKTQLRFSRRIQCKSSDANLYDRGLCQTMTLRDVPDIHRFASLLPILINENVSVVNFVVLQNHTLDTNVVLMLRISEINHFYVIHIILQDVSGNLFIVVKEVTDLTYYDEHFQSYSLDEALRHTQSLRCINVDNLNEFFVSRISQSSQGKFYIPKRCF